MRKAIVIGGEKGGTGKSTISVNLAIMASIMGKDVLHIDTDKQETAARFFSKRRDKKIEPTPRCVQIYGKNLHTEIEDLCRKYELIIIESGGQDSVELRAALASPSVECLYTPLQPSEFDLETLQRMDEIVYFANSYNPNLEAYIVFNHAPTHSKISSLNEAIYIATEETENLAIANTSIRHRVAFQYAASESLAVVEFELERIQSLPPYQAKKFQPKASMEMCALYKEIFNEDFKSDIVQYFHNAQLLEEEA